MKNKKRIEILNKIKEIKDHEKQKGTPFYKLKDKKLREELSQLVPYGVRGIAIGDYVVERSYNPVLKRGIISIYEIEAWKRKQIVAKAVGLKKKEKEMREASLELERKYQYED